MALQFASIFTVCPWRDGQLATETELKPSFTAVDVVVVVAAAADRSRNLSFPGFVQNFPPSASTRRNPLLRIFSFSLWPNLVIWREFQANFSFCCSRNFFFKQGHRIFLCFANMCSSEQNRFRTGSAENRDRTKTSAKLKTNSFRGGWQCKTCNDVPLSFEKI